MNFLLLSCLARSDYIYNYDECTKPGSCYLYYCWNDVFTTPDRSYCSIRGNCGVFNVQCDYLCECRANELHSDYDCDVMRPTLFDKMRRCIPPPTRSPWPTQSPYPSPNQTFFPSPYETPYETPQNSPYMIKDYFFVRNSLFMIN